MRYAPALMALAALLGVAGCQSNLDMRNLNRHGAYAQTVWETEGFAFESDTRLVVLDFHEPPLGHIVDSDTYIAYISIPLHPEDGLQFNNPSFGVGWSDVGMSFAGIFDPTPDPLPYGRRVKVAPNDLLDYEGSGVGPYLTPVDPRYQAYAEALRESMYNLEMAGAPAPESPLPPAQEADDD